MKSFFYGKCFVESQLCVKVRISNIFSRIEIYICILFKPKTLITVFLVFGYKLPHLNETPACRAPAYFEKSHQPIPLYKFKSIITTENLHFNVVRKQVDFIKNLKTIKISQ